MELLKSLAIKCWCFNLHFVNISQKIQGQHNSKPDSFNLSFSNIKPKNKNKTVKCKVNILPQKMKFHKYTTEEYRESDQM